MQRLAKYIWDKHPEYAGEELLEDVLQLLKDQDARVAYLEQSRDLLLEAKAQAVTVKPGDILVLSGVADAEQADQWFKTTKRLQAEGRLPENISVSALPPELKLESFSAEQRFQITDRVRSLYLSHLTLEERVAFLEVVAAEWAGHPPVDAEERAKFLNSLQELSREGQDSFINRMRRAYIEKLPAAEQVLFLERLCGIYLQRIPEPEREEIIESVRAA